MAMKKGASPEIVGFNIKEMVRGGKKQKHAIASALASARKYKRMPEEEDDLGDVNVQGDMGISGYAVNPKDPIDEGLSENVMLAQAINDDLQEKRYAANDNTVEYEEDHLLSGKKMNRGGIAQPEKGESRGTRPNLEWIDDGTEEPMSSMPNKPGGLEHAIIDGVPDSPGLSAEARIAIARRKKGRRYDGYGK